jgi:hypothetical protein
MNSTLQCLSALPPLAAFLLNQEQFLPHINTVNLVGSKGELALALSGLLSEVWSGHYKVVVPDAFKKKLQLIAPQFRGYQQHDAQEMLLVTLNSLHEDLLAPAGPNGARVEKSPIQEMFAGMFRSTVNCDTCHVESTVYEPFYNLAVPVPEKEEKKQRVTFFPASPKSLPSHLGVRVNKSGTVAHLYQRLSEMLHERPTPDRLVSIQMSGTSNTCYTLTPVKQLGGFREVNIRLPFCVVLLC